MWPDGLLVEKPRSAPTEVADSQDCVHVPAAVRREVWKRLDLERAGCCRRRRPWGSRRDCRASTFEAKRFSRRTTPGRSIGRSPQRKSNPERSERPGAAFDGGLGRTASLLADRVKRAAPNCAPRRTPHQVPRGVTISEFAIRRWCPLAACRRRWRHVATLRRDEISASPVALACRFLKVRLGPPGLFAEQPRRSPRQRAAEHQPPRRPAGVARSPPPGHLRCHEPRLPRDTSGRVCPAAGGQDW